MKCLVTHTDFVAGQLKSFDNEIRTLLITNFIMPLHDQDYDNKIDCLIGKYKPSWIVELVQSPLKNPWMKLAEENQLYHYHFGYRFYTDGSDPDYHGHVSDGIIHIQKFTYHDSIELRMIEICLSHSPFKIPITKINSQASTSIQ